MKRRIDFSLGYAYSVPPGDLASSPEVTRCTSVPCRPQSPWCKWANENAFASIVQARPIPPLADRFILGFPIDYGPVLLLMPFGFHLAMDTLPSEVQQAVALGRSWLYPAFAFVPV